MADAEIKITPVERLSNLADAALMRYIPGSYASCEYVLLPDGGKLTAWYYAMSGAVNFSYEKDGHYQVIDTPTAAGLMGWKWTTPCE